MFFEELVEQHRVHRVVAHGVNVAVLIAHHQGGIYLRYFFGNKAELWSIFLVTLVVKDHWLKRQNRFAGLYPSVESLS